MDRDLISGYQLSPPQKRLWRLQADYRLPNYAQCAILLEGKLDKRAIGAALSNLVKRHDILRTVFRLLPGMTIPLQVVTGPKILWQPEIKPGRWDLRPQVDRLWSEVNARAVDGELKAPIEACLLNLSQNRHILLLLLPALLTDAGGLKNIVRELSCLYAAERNNGLLQDDPVQYPIISEWLNELIDSEDAVAGRRFWKALVNEFDRSEVFHTKLPLETHPSQTNNFQPQIVSLNIDGGLVTRLESLSERHNVTLRELCLACWQILLWRLTQSANVIVGTAFDGRTDEELEKALGLLTEYLPIRCNISPNLTISDVIQQVSESLRDANSWQWCFTWEDIVESGKSADDYFFPFCFDFDDLSAKYEASDMTFSIFKHCAYLDRFKIKLGCIQSVDTLVTEFHYDSAIYQPSQIDRLAGQYHTLLESVARNQQTAIDKLDVLSPLEQTKIIFEFNRTGTNFQTGKCIHQLFEDQLESSCDSVAIIFEEQLLTFAEFNARANQLAHYLRGLGVGPEVMVALCAERSPAMMIGLLGILKSGGVYVPLDPEYPKERLAYMLQDTQAPVLLTQKQLAGRLPGHNAREVYLDADWPNIAQCGMDNPSNLTAESNLAYAIYTSGSTGTPKGVLTPHREMVSHCFAIQKAYELCPDDRFLLFASSNFDASLEQILPPLVSRAAVVLRGNDMWDTRDLCRRISEFALTVIELPTAYWKLFTHECVGLPQSAVGSSLRLMISAGEAMFVDQQYQWLQTPLRSARLLNGYGPTEATITATAFDCAITSDKRKYPLSTPIGYPFANRAIYILDIHGEPSPIGTSGELHIGGIGLARGYLNRPDLTAQRFIPGAFGAEPGARLYRTGDLARYWPDGEIEFLGRLDHQVKIRGFRIEPGEIEAALRQHSEVAEAVVVTQECEAEGAQLIAYAVSNRRQSLSASSLRTFLREKLPEYMIPAHFVVLDALPLTPGGKVDRQMLPPFRQSDIEDRPSGAHVAPRTPLEATLAEIWTQVFKRQQIGVYDNFFELGGHSLLGIQIITRLNERLDVGVKIRDLFFNPTIEQLARRVCELEALMENNKGVALVASPHKEYYDISHAQRRLWFINQLIEGDVSYIIPFGVYIRGEVDVRIFEETWKHLIARHASLRTLFIAKDGVPKALIKPDIELSHKFHDFTDLGIEKAKRLIRKEVEEDQRRPFSLSEGPLFRIMLYRLEEKYFYLYLNMHHIITDGWSTGVLFNDFLFIYNSLANERPIPLEPVKFQYNDYVAWEKETERAGLWSEQEEYFLKDLEKPLPPLNLPLDFPRFEVQRYNGNEVFFEVPQELRSRLGEIARARSISLFMLALTAYFVVLRHLTQQNDIIVGFPVAGRTMQNIEKMVGFFVNTLVIRIKFDNVAGIEDLLNQVREKCLRAYDNQAYPFDLLVKKVNPDRQLDRSAIILTTFALHNYGFIHPSVKITGFEECEVDEIVEKTSKFDLSLTGIESKDRLRFSFTYNSDLFKEETIRTFSSQYLKVLQYLVEALC